MAAAAPSERLQLLKAVDRVWPGADAVSLFKRAVASILLFHPRHTSKWSSISSQLGQHILCGLGDDSKYAEVLGTDSAFNVLQSGSLALNIYEYRQAAGLLHIAAESLPAVELHVTPVPAVSAAASPALTAPKGKQLSSNEQQQSDDQQMPCQQAVAPVESSTQELLLPGRLPTQKQPSGIVSQQLPQQGGRMVTLQQEQQQALCSVQLGHSTRQPQQCSNAAQADTQDQQKLMAKVWHGQRHLQHDGSAQHQRQLLQHQMRGELQLPSMLKQQPDNLQLQGHKQCVCIVTDQQHQQQQQEVVCSVKNRTQRLQLLQAVDHIWPAHDAESVLKRAAATVLLLSPQHTMAAAELQQQLHRRGLAGKDLGITSSTVQHILATDPVFQLHSGNYVRLNIAAIIGVVEAAAAAMSASNLVSQPTEAAGTAVDRQHSRLPLCRSVTQHLHGKTSVMTVDTNASQQQQHKMQPQPTACQDLIEQQQLQSGDAEADLQRVHTVEQDGLQQQQQPQVQCRQPAPFSSERRWLLHAVDRVWPGQDAAALMKRAAAAILLFAPAYKVKLNSLVQQLARHSLSKKALNLQGQSFKDVFLNDALFAVGTRNHVTLNMEMYRQASTAASGAAVTATATATQQASTATGQYKASVQQQYQQQQLTQPPSMRTVGPDADLLHAVDSVWPGCEPLAVLKRSTATLLLSRRHYSAPFRDITSELGQRSLSKKRLGLRGASHESLLLSGDDDMFRIYQVSKKNKSISLNVHALRAAASSVQVAAPALGGGDVAAAAAATAPASNGPGAAAAADSAGQEVLASTLLGGIAPFEQHQQQQPEPGQACLFPAAQLHEAFKHIWSGEDPISVIKRASAAMLACQPGYEAMVRDISRDLGQQALSRKQLGIKGISLHTLLKYDPMFDKVLATRKKRSCCVRLNVERIMQAAAGLALESAAAAQAQATIAAQSEAVTGQPLEAVTEQQQFTPEQKRRLMAALHNIWQDSDAVSQFRLAVADILLSKGCSAWMNDMQHALVQQAQTRRRLGLKGVSNESLILSDPMFQLVKHTRKNKLIALNMPLLRETAGLTSAQEQNAYIHGREAAGSSVTAAAPAEEEETLQLPGDVEKQQSGDKQKLNLLQLLPPLPHQEQPADEQQQQQSAQQFPVLPALKAKPWLLPRGDPVQVHALAQQHLLNSQQRQRQLQQQHAVLLPSHGSQLQQYHARMLSQQLQLQGPQTLPAPTLTRKQRRKEKELGKKARKRERKLQQGQQPACQASMLQSEPKRRKLDLQQQNTARDPITWVSGGQVDYNDFEPGLSAAAGAVAHTRNEDREAAQQADVAAEAEAAAAAQAAAAGQWGVAHALMAKMGYRPGEGLGRASQGIRQPLRPRSQQHRKGLGFAVQDTATVTPPCAGTPGMDIEHTQ